MDIGQILVLALVALIVFFVLRAVTVVRQGWEYTVESFGRYTKTLKPGLTFLIPFYQRVGHKVNMRERVIDVPSQDVITKDNAMVTADAVVFIQVLDPRKAAYEVNDLDHAIQNLCLTNVRTVVGSMDLDEVLSRRDEINAKLLT
ncbi:MAG: paraslipin, partial [Pseudomonadota bacterium]